MMIQLINKMKRKDGFTLVELIVVLVILAILAAFTIPAMLGYINDAREKAGLAEARASFIAAQATVDNIYGPMASNERTEATRTTIAAALSDTLDADGKMTVTPADSTNITTAEATKLKFNDYASGDLTKGAIISSVVISADGQITKYVYALPGDYTYTYANDTWTIEETTTADTTADTNANS